ncbi:MAG: WXG100 family type VII secretion target [Gemmataceae bacterium]|nr:WXG100 family type VII secretion target [Gemmataceae bacterium]MDW8266309.1 WXG100 family type VII secretion target [Gemmataceae bacterium]
MPQAIVDPAELRRFAHNLKVFRSELENQISTLHGQMLRLGDTWRDQEHEKFLQEFEQTMQALTRFMAATDEHLPFLLRKAERVEEYLQQR